MVGLWANGGRTVSANANGPAGPAFEVARITAELVPQSPSSQWLTNCAANRWNVRCADRTREQRGGVDRRMVRPAQVRMAGWSGMIKRARLRGRFRKSVCRYTK